MIGEYFLLAAEESTVSHLSDNTSLDQLSASPLKS